jgi:5-hydroxyisourate hydrolase
MASCRPSRAAGSSVVSDRIARMPGLSISTHVLDTSVGRPAAGIRVQLEGRVGPVGKDDWRVVGSGEANSDGRVPNLVPEGASIAPGEFRLTFDTRQYFAASSTATLYPAVTIVFEVAAGQTHYHVPLLLNPFGYTTYRGS